ncbi:MAG: F0F1 ATP synthase subunit B [Campylobacteraceae bacterium 4484_4]|nr:MAG: F0F1 ATP synthase subunit B [Campylobacteraceae bacterium 4484_4]
MKKLSLLALFLIPAVVLASGGHSEESRYLAQTGRETDFIPRIFNFLIFAGMLYYLLANPIKNFFTGRQKGIADQLKEIEAKLQASKEEKKEAEAKIEENKKKAVEIVETAKKEAEILAAKIASNSESELKIMEKQFEEKMTLEERRVIREAIKDVLSNNIESDDIYLDERKVVDLLDKKVA